MRHTISGRKTMWCNWKAFDSLFCFATMCVCSNIYTCDVEQLTIWFFFVSLIIYCCCWCCCIVFIPYIQIFSIDLAKCYVNFVFHSSHHHAFVVGVVLLFFYFSSIPSPEFRLIVHRHFLFHLFSLSRVKHAHESNKESNKERKTWRKGEREKKVAPVFNSFAIDIAKTRNFSVSKHF